MQKNLNMSLWIHSRSALGDVEKLGFHVLSDPGNITAHLCFYSFMFLQKQTDKSLEFYQKALKAAKGQREIELMCQYELGNISNIMVLLEMNVLLDLKQDLEIFKF